MTIIQNFSTDSSLKKQINKIYTDLEIVQIKKEIDIHTFRLSEEFEKLDFKNKPYLVEFEKAIDDAKKFYSKLSQTTSKSDLEELYSLKKFTVLIEKLDKFVNHLFIEQMRAKAGISD